MNLTDRSNVSQLITALDKSGAKTPPAVTTAWQDTQKLSEGVRAIGCLPETVYAAIASAIQRGADPASDAEVQRILASGQISNGGCIAGVDDIAYGAFRQTCAEGSADIVAAFSKPFDVAARTLVDAHQVLGDVSLSDSDAVRHQVLRISAPTYEQWMSQALEGKHADPWALVILGLDLALPAFEQYRERVDTIAQGAEQAAAEYQQDKQAYMTGRRPPIRV